MTADQQGAQFSSAQRNLLDEDEIELISVGVDIGSSTSHLAFSRLTLEQQNARYVVTKRELVHQSPIHFTPYVEDADTSRPLSPYAASKKGAEVLAYTYHYLYGTDVTVFRYFTVYGPSGRPDMSLFRFAQWINEERPLLVYGDGKQSRDFTYVDDIARGTIAGLKPLGYEVINLGSDTPTVLMDVVRYIEERVGQKANIEYTERHAADVLATWADITKARELLGWEPKTSWQQGVDRLLDWYAENRDWTSKVVTD